MRLPLFIKRAGYDFQISAWLREVGHDVRHEYPDGIDCECPNVESHSTGDEKDRAFRVWDGSGFKDGKEFGAHCRHQTCQTASEDDRGWYLDKLCQHYGIKHTDELHSWCPSVLQEETEREAGVADKAVTAEAELKPIDDRIAGLTATTPGAEISNIITLLARRPIHEQVEVDRRISRIAEQTGAKKKTLETNLKYEQKKERAKTAGTFDANVERLYRQLCEKNLPATLFLTSDEQRVLRVNGRPGKRWLQEMTPATWKAELNARVPGPLPHDLDTITCIANRKGHEFPVVRAIANVPVFGSDGSLRVVEGYDPTTQDYVSIDPNLALPAIPDVVTQDHVDEALWWLLAEALRDVPFSDSFEGGDSTPIYVDRKDDHGYPMPNWERGAASRANFLVMVLQPFVRAIIGEGACPAFHIDKTTHAEGGTLITHMPAVIFTGAHLRGRAKPKDGDEFQKSMLAALRQMPPYVLFDNLTGAVDNGDLAMAITSRHYAGRELGHSHDTECEIVGSFIYTGVGIEFSKELHRRNVPIRLDANTDAPGKRSFKYDFDQFLVTNRGRLIWSCLVLIKNWVERGMPRGNASLPSFEKWAAVMGGILSAAGVGGFLANLDNYREHALEVRTVDATLVEALIRTFGFNSFTVSEAITIMGVNPDVAGALAPIGLQPGGRDGEDTQANKNRFSKYLKSNIARRVHLVTDLKAITKMGLPQTNPSVTPRDDGKVEVRVVLRQVGRASPIKWQFFPNVGEPAARVEHGVVVGL
jgi:hypothetical protein